MTGQCSHVQCACCLLAKISISLSLFFSCFQSQNVCLAIQKYGEHVVKSNKVQCKTFQSVRTNKLNVKRISENRYVKDVRKRSISTVALNWNNNISFCAKFKHCVSHAPVAAAPVAIAENTCANKNQWLLRAAIVVVHCVWFDCSVSVATLGIGYDKYKMDGQHSHFSKSCARFFVWTQMGERERCTLNQTSKLKWYLLFRFD